MTGRSEERNLHRVLRAVAEGHRTPLDVEHHLAMPRHAVVTRLTELERRGHVAYDRSTDAYDLTESALSLFNRNPKNSPRDAGPSPARAGSVGASLGHENPGAAPTLEQQREALIEAMEGPHAVALDVVSDDEPLRDRLSDAVEQGMPPIDLSGVPRYRRPAAVETALDEWARGTLGGPCSRCGCTVARTGYIDRGTTHEPPTPSFAGGVCDWCREAVNMIGADRVRTHVFTAKLGLRNINGRGSIPIPFFAELREQLPTVRPTREPWGYLPQNFLSAMLTGLDLPPHCYVTTRYDQMRNSWDGITARLWTPDEIPAQRNPSPTEIPGIKWGHSDNENAAFQKHQERVRAANAAIRERYETPNDFVEPLELQSRNAPRVRADFMSFPLSSTSH